VIENSEGPFRQRGRRDAPTCEGRREEIGDHWPHGHAMGDVKMPRTERKVWGFGLEGGANELFCSVGGM
jgi:hypothetical protein